MQNGVPIAMVFYFTLFYFIILILIFSNQKVGKFWCKFEYVFYFWENFI
jgi:uncharacterized RDD family membrane protein YckC